MMNAKIVVKRGQFNCLQRMLAVVLLIRGKTYDKRHKIKSEVRTELDYVETPFDAE